MGSDSPPNLVLTSNGSASRERKSANPLTRPRWVKAPGRADRNSHRSTWRPGPDLSLSFTDPKPASGHYVADLISEPGNAHEEGSNQESFVKNHPRFPDGVDVPPSLLLRFPPE